MSKGYEVSVHPQDILNSSNIVLRSSTSSTNRHVLDLPGFRESTATKVCSTSYTPSHILLPLRTSTCGLWPVCIHNGRVTVVSATRPSTRSTNQCIHIFRITPKSLTLSLQQAKRSSIRSGYVDLAYLSETTAYDCSPF